MMAGFALINSQRLAANQLPPPLSIGSSQLAPGKEGLVTIKTSTKNYDVMKTADHQDLDMDFKTESNEITTLVQTIASGLSCGIRYATIKSNSKSTYLGKIVKPSFSNIATEYRYEKMEPLLVYQNHPNFKVAAGFEHIAYRETTNIIYSTGDSSGAIISKMAHLRTNVSFTYGELYPNFSISYLQSYQQKNAGSNFQDPRTFRALSISKVTENMFLSLKGRHRSWSLLRTSDKNLFELEAGIIIGSELKDSYSIFIKHQPPFAIDASNVTLANLGRNSVTLVTNKVIPNWNLNYFIQASYTRGTGSTNVTINGGSDQVLTYDQEIKIMSYQVKLGLTQTL